MDADLEIAARSLAGVQRLTVNGADAAFDDASGLWRLTVPLAAGADALVLEAFTLDGATAVDTAYAVSLPLSVGQPAPALPEARAGHTATRTLGGVALAGGVGEGGAVLGTARRLTELGLAFAFGDAIALQTPRTGHAALRLPDDRVLLLGGTTRPTPEDAASFAATPEALDLASGENRPVVMRGEGLRRTGHVATLLGGDGRSLIVVLGGRAPGAGGRIFSPSTVEFFEFREGTAGGPGGGAAPDTLVRLSPAGGASGPGAYPDPAQVVLRSGPEGADAVLVGQASGDASALRLAYRAPGFATPVDVEAAAVGTPEAARTAADGAPIGPGLAVVAGGRGADGRPLATLAAYADVPGRFFRFPDAVRLAAGRADLAVTLAPSGRILALGGRDETGAPTRALDVIAF